MKKIFLGVVALVAVSIANAQQTADVKPQPSQTTPEVKDITKFFSFTNADYDFGKTAHNKPVEFDVVIKNISNETASVDNVTVGCGCTTPKFEKGKKFAPGESFKVTIAFNGSALGAYSRTATIYLTTADGSTFSRAVIFKGETYEVPTGAPANNTLDKMKPASN